MGRQSVSVQFRTSNVNITTSGSFVFECASFEDREAIVVANHSPTSSSTRTGPKARGAGRCCFGSSVIPK